jgi:redox-sensitive bicupin YhaK (pirin superfamily)
MNVFDVAGKVSGSGEYILGYDATGSHACYLIYGVLKAGEMRRELKPGKGHEEMLIVVRGEVTVTGAATATLKQGQAIHLRGEETCYAENRTDAEAVYVMAGGHSESGHEH